MTEIPGSNLKGKGLNILNNAAKEVASEDTDLESDSSSALRGKLVQRPESQPTTNRLIVSKNLARSATKRIGISPPATKSETESRPVYEHSPTWDLEFGNKGIGYGDIEIDGFEARNSNHSSSQDAFAVNPEKGRFAVADGLGGAGTDKDGTRFLAKFISDYAVTHGIDKLFNEDVIQDVYNQAHKEFREAYGRNMEPPRLLGKLKTTAATTLTYTELLPGNHARIVTVGDSPVFITDSTYNPIHQFGEDAQSGSTDGTMGFNFRMKADGTRETAPQKDEVIRGLHIEDRIIECNDNTRIVLGSDYFSEAVSVYNQPLASYIGKSAKEYHDLTRTSGKPDDATLVAINPSTLIAHSPRR